MRILDYVFLLRPMLIIPVWTIALLGVRASTWRERGCNPFLLDRYPIMPFSGFELRIVIMLGLAALVSGGAFILNQIYDIESDRKNKKLFLLPEGRVSLTEAWVLYFITTLGGIAGAYFLNWQLGVLLTAGALLGIQYSHPRFGVRSDPYRSARNNVLAHGMLAFLFGWVMQQNFNIESVLKSVPYMCGVAAIYLNTTLPDAEGDEATGKLTYGIQWGVRKTQTLVLIWLGAGLIGSVMAADYGFAIATACALPFAVFARYTGSIRNSVLSSKVAILALSLFAVIFFPPYIVLLVLTIVITRLYYSNRFSLRYPVLREENR